ncbi:tuliposide B-converting enzyme 1, amyloplastic-like [Miscanthus floridulus]|uniref:tuliposide B-converting enzyme 1, amyloplastic-like n=1 Tax=Miscanthus floridulus TaxID=154761 RepID=UPI003459BE47
MLTTYDDSWQALNWVAQNAVSGLEPWLQDQANLSWLFITGDSAGEVAVTGEMIDPTRRHQYEAMWSFIYGGQYGIDDLWLDPLSLPASQWRKLERNDDFQPHGLACAAAIEGSRWRTRGGDE